MGTNTEINRIVFFDGVCNLCNASVNFIIDRDPHSKFKFAALQSDIAKEMLPDFKIDPNELESFVFYEDNKVYRRSRAALEIARRMRGGWPLFYAFVVIPGFVRDAIYNFVARNRYKWFGRQDSCRMPTPELSSRFLDS